MQLRVHLTRRAAFAVLATTLTAGAAVAGTVHRFSVSPATGSEGAQAFVQTTSSGGALQGEVAASVNTHIAIPFGVLGEYDNAQFGVGVAGVSTTGYAVAGEALGSSPSVLAYAGGTGPGLEALTTSSGNTSPALYAAPANGAQANGAEAHTTATGSSSNAYYAAVRGFDDANDDGFNVGVEGVTTDDGYGVRGIAGSNAVAAVGALSTDRTTALLASAASGVGVAGSSQGSTGVSASAGLAGATPAPDMLTLDGVYARSTGGAGVFSTSVVDPPYVGEMQCNVYTSSATLSNGQNCAGLYLQVDGTKGYPLEVYEPNSSCVTKYPFFLDADGDLSVRCGSIVDKNGTFSQTRNPGSDRVTYALQSAESNVEDFGSAQLVNGEARVALGGDFKETIDGGSPYMVFLTPYGDTRGLYVASRSAAGFVVREAQGGRSTMAFDYRVVARSYGSRPSARLPHLADIVHEPRGPAGDPTFATRRAKEARLFAGVKSESVDAFGKAPAPRAYRPRAVPAAFAEAARTR